MKCTQQNKRKEERKMGLQPNSNNNWQNFAPILVVLAPIVAQYPITAMIAFLAAGAATLLKK